MRTARRRAVYRDVADARVCDECQQFCGEPGIDKWLFADNRAQRDASGEQQGIDHVRREEQGNVAFLHNRPLASSRGPQE